jgi:tetratricopeptide (TPR) repeat protein
VTPAVARLLLEGEARRRLGDEAGMTKALEEATVTAPGLNAAHLILATAYEKAGQYDSAIERYRLVLAASPTDLVAGNNLAYALAVYKNAPKEALPIAEKAYTTSKGEARVTDTLGWIHYLLGNTAEAEALIAQAAASAPTNAEIHLHLAYAHLARNRADLGLAALKKSLQLDAALASRGEVKKLLDDLVKADKPR